MTDRPTALRLLSIVEGTALAGSPVLVGSSALFGFETSVAALTEDVDFAVPESVVTAHGDALASRIEALGFDHPAGSATFVERGTGVAFDLLGHGDAGDGDHVGGGGRLRVMVFEDLSRLLADPRAVRAVGTGRGLTPAGFVASKLLTERAHKGAKDKIQALLVLAERSGDRRALADVRDLLRLFDPARRDDAVADAQGSFMALAQDPTFRDAGAEGYARHAEQAERGLAILLGLLDG